MYVFSHFRISDMGINLAMLWHLKKEIYGQGLSWHIGLYQS